MAGLSGGDRAVGDHRAVGGGALVLALAVRQRGRLRRLGHEPVGAGGLEDRQVVAGGSWLSVGVGRRSVSTPLGRR
jgi:hypothetical protein